jgi:ubiquinone/menaquinone biosynthesis C-methylase UbiE
MMVKLLKRIENKEANKSLIRMIPPKKGLALDIGCGEGWVSREIKKKGYHVIGLDIDEKMLKKANKFCHETILYDCQKRLPYPENYFDLIVCLDVLEHLKYPERTLSEIYRVLKSQGACIIRIPNGKMDFLFALEGHVRFITMKRILKWFDKYGFKVVKFNSFGIVPFWRKVVCFPQFYVFQVRKR